MLNDGSKLEQEFAKWMESELGYIEVYVNTRNKGKTTTRGYQVDIHAVTYNKKWALIKKIGLFLIASATLAFTLEVFNIPDLRILLTNILSSIDPSLATYPVVLIGIVGLVMWYFGKINTDEHTWVECKDYKGKVKRDQIFTFQSKIEDTQNGDSVWYPNEAIFVAENGFDPDALRFASEYGILCFEREKDGNNFVRVN